MPKKQSKILAAVHATAKGLFDAGAIDRVTMREFDTLSVAPVGPLCPAQIKRIREASHVSQAVFKRFGCSEPERSPRKLDR